MVTAHALRWLWLGFMAEELLIAMGQAANDA